MSTIILFIGFVSAAAGIVGLFNPSLVRARSRWQVVPVALGFVAAVGVAQLVSPDPATGHPTTTRVFGIINILIWLFILGFCVRRAERTAPVESVHLSPEVIAVIRSGLDDDDDQPACDRLTKEFERYRTGEIDIDGYRQSVLSVSDGIDGDIELLRERRGSMDRDDFAAQLEQLEEDAQECRWRLEWIDEQRTKPEADPRFGGKGKWARFEYVDSDGSKSKRTIAMWERRGRYIVGYDRSRKEERTFRQDRITEWLAG